MYLGGAAAFEKLSYSVWVVRREVAIIQFRQDCP